jgi:hypothetical protein
MARTLDTNKSRARFAHLNLIFTVVIERYRDILNLSPLVASQIDSDAPHNRNLDFAQLDYKVDIENACEAAVQGQPNEAELKDAIDRLTAGDQTISDPLAKQVIRLCGREFEERRLEPALYLRRIRRGSSEQVTR